MNQICVIGDVNVDIVSLMRESLQVNSDTQTTNSLSLGGSPCNMAMWLAYLGANTQFMAAVGDDLLGNWIKAELESGKLSPQHIQVVPNMRSGTCLILVNSDGNRTMLPDPGANLFFQLTENQKQLVASSSVVVMSAYTFLRAETRPIAIQMLELVEQSPARLVLDAASSAPIAKAGIELVQNYLARAELVLANQDEFEILDTDNWAASLPNLVVKLGPQGARWLINAQESCQVSANQVNVVDTTGAGDSFLAGLVSVLVEHEDWYALSDEDRKNALSRAIEVAEQNITSIGAGPKN